MRLRDTNVAPVLLALIAAVTAWSTMLAWRSFTVDEGGYLQPLLVVAGVVAVSGLLARAARLPGGLVFLVQVLLGVATVSLFLTGSPLPYGGAWTELKADVSLATDTAAKLRPPVPVVGGVQPLLLGGGLACLLLVDLLACTLRRAALAGLPLLAIYAVPFSVVDDGVPWWCFAMGAAGYLTMLVLQESLAVGRWGRRLDPDSTTGRGRLGTGAGQIGAAATALALVFPALLPTLEVHLLDWGPGDGGGGKITVTNPLVGLQRELTRGQDLPLVRITTDDPDPQYLRIAALVNFGDNEWSAGDRNVPERNDAHGKMPAPQGLAPWVDRSEHGYEVDILDDFESRWLPTQHPISAIEAVGDWRYDSSTMDFLGGDNQSASGMSYTFTALDVRLRSENLRTASAGAGAVAAAFRELPPDFPDSVRDLADRVTADVRTPFAKAVALQQWFRVDGGFTYNDEIDLGSSPEDLEQFLANEPGSREGFCQQFAAAMAALARSLGIPARVAVGFLTPEEVAPNTYVYSAHDMHAWPELYFTGAGWVRFEPTPSTRAEEVPPYTRNIDAGAPEVPSASAAPSASASGGQSNAPRPQEDLTETGGGTSTAAGTGWWWTLTGALALMAVVGVLLVPSRIRRRRRAARLEDGSPEAAWAEVRDTVVDLALPWPEGLSPRAAGEILARYVGTGAGHDALLRLVAQLELARYAPRPAGAVPASDVEAIIAALTAGMSDRTRRRAAWWPRSVVSRAARYDREQAIAEATQPERLARDLVDSVN